MTIRQLWNAIRRKPSVVPMKGWRREDGPKALADTSIQPSFSTFGKYNGATGYTMTWIKPASNPELLKKFDAALKSIEKKYPKPVAKKPVKAKGKRGKR